MDTYGYWAKRFLINTSQFHDLYPTYRPIA